MAAVASSPPISTGCLMGIAKGRCGGTPPPPPQPQLAGAASEVTQGLVRDHTSTTVGMHPLSAPRGAHTRPAQTYTELYDMEAELGEGQFGKVSRVKHKTTSELCGRALWPAPTRRAHDATQVCDEAYRLEEAGWGAARESVPVAAGD